MDRESGLRSIEQLTSVMGVQIPFGAVGLQTCMLPRELFWQEVAPFHVDMTQDSDWPELHTVKRCRKYYVFVRCHVYALQLTVY